ncbi:MAG: FG-GAP-like repeat-containing protein [Candidatus Eisenbacteria bacterium]
MLSGRAFEKSLLTMGFLILAVSVARPAWAGPQFTAPFRETPSGLEHMSLATADFDNDGLLDVVLSEANPTSDLVFMRQMADHSFAEAARWSPPSPLSQLTVGDFDGDGHLDVAGLEYTGDIQIFLSDGSFGLAGLFSRPGPMGAIFLAKANLNGGRDDLVAVSYYSNELRTYTDGVSPLMWDATVATTLYPSSLGVGDLNGDGIDDIVLGTEYLSGAVQILYSDGAGDIAAYVALSGGPNSGSGVAISDVNGDGRRDILVGAGDGTGVAVFLQSSPHVFASPNYYGGMAGSSNFRLHCGDLDNDGDLDVVTMGPASVVLINGGTGTFTAPNLALPQSTYNHYGSSLADFDGDGNLDLLVTGNYAAGLLTARGNGDCTFESDDQIPLATADEFAFLDRDLDGDLDLVTVNGNMSSVEVYDRVGGTLSQVQVDFPGNPTGLATGDFNGDGYPDFAVIESSMGVVAVYLNDGAGNFPVGAWTAVPTGENPVSIAAGDVNGDGLTDLALACGLGGETLRGATRPVGMPYNEGIMVLLATTPGFEPPVFHPTPGTCPSNVTIGDLNGDSHGEVVATMACSGELVVVPGNASPGTGTPFSIPTVTGASVSAIADLDTDGLRDLVVLSSGGELQHIRNMGAFTWGTPVTQPTVQQANRLSVADFDQDGMQDVAALGFGSVVAVHAGVPGGDFGTQHDFGTAASPSGIRANDFDGDGDQDLLVSSRGAYYLQYHRNGLFATSGVDGRPSTPAGLLAVRAPAPNPARGATTVEFTLSSAARVSAEVLDVSGRLVRRLSPARSFEPGTHALRWDVRDTDGRLVPAGVYFVRVSTPGYDAARKVLVTH